MTGSSTVLRFWLPLSALVALFVALHIFIAAAPAGPLERGRFFDPDSYSRLVRVQQLHDSGNWYMAAFPRSNAPYGEAQHSTRPMDVLLLAGAWALEPFLGFKTSLYWWGMFVSPALYILTGLAVAWVASPLMSRNRSLWAAGLFAAQFSVLSYSMAGRPDHHSLLFFIFTVMLGASVRAAITPARRDWSIAAGILSGIGVWLSLELLIVLAAILASQCLCWIFGPDDEESSQARLRSATLFGLGLLAAVLAGTLLERPPSQFLAPEYDRLSVVHVLVAALIVAFWTAQRFMSSAGVLAGDRIARLIAAASVGALVLAVMIVTYPKFFAGPTADLDPEIGRVFLSDVKELRSPFVSKSAIHAWIRPGITLLLTACALTYLLPILFRRTDRVNRKGWLIVGLTAVLYVPAGLLVERILPFTGIVLSIAAAGSVVWLLDSLSRRSRRLSIGIATAFTAVIVSHAALNAKLLSLVLGTAVDCLTGVAELSRHIDDPDRENEKPLTILAQPDLGPELLYRTRHNVVATPSHRNPGILVFSRALGATDDRQARRIIAERGIDRIIVCRGMHFEADPNRRILYERLLESTPPDWLELVKLPLHVSFDYFVYRVVISR